MVMIMRNLLRAGMLLVLVGIPVYKWAHPSLPKLQVRAFDERDWQRFQKLDKFRAMQARNRAAVESIFASCSTPTTSLIEPVLRYAGLRNLSPRIVAATIVAESSCRMDAVSHAGAVGLMQVNPSVWGHRRELKNPERNLEIGTKILSDYVRVCGGVRNGLRHYFGVSPDSDESDDYADKVLMIARRR